MVAKEKPRLLILLDRLVVGGQAVDVIPLAFYFKQAFEVKLIYGEKKPDDTEATYLLDLYPGIDAIKIPSLKKTLNLVTNIKACIDLNREIKYFKPHIIHTNAAKCGVIGRLAGFYNKVPVIVHTFHGHFFHSYFNRFFSSGIIATEKILTRISSAIIATSSRQMDDLVYTYKIAPKNKVTIIGLGIDEGFLASKNTDLANNFAAKYQVDSDTVAIGIIARIVQVKNFNLFVAVVNKVLHKTNQKVIFFVIGDGYLKKDVQQQLTGHGIGFSSDENPLPNAPVIFTSWVSQIGEALAALDIVVLTSNNEGTGLSLAESQYCGKPVVATNVGGVPDTLIDGKTGFLVPPANAGAFAEKLLCLIEDRALRRQMGNAAMIFAREKFAKKKEIESLTQLYIKLLEQ
ncbi:glycosyltransferase [Parasediminibacterium sp. JCM 36343]|uniref:glycosyltransferase n=1 Tax=Parasediminibacterium sp. JCM 36343 TaxID=3374279 RepID=UPI00397AC555